MSLGNRLHALRSAKGLSLRQVERLSGVPFSTISRIENDKGVPDTDTLGKLADFYGISFAILLDAYAPKGLPTDEQTNAFLVGHGYNLEQLRTEINALIDKLRAEAKAILAEKEATP